MLPRLDAGFIVALLQHDLTFCPCVRLKGCGFLAADHGYGGMGGSLPNLGRSRRLSLGRLLRERERERVKKSNPPQKCRTDFHALQVGLGSGGELGAGRFLITARSVPECWATGCGVPCWCKEIHGPIREAWDFHHRLGFSAGGKKSRLF
jgi:hypothetical protein